MNEAEGPAFEIPKKIEEILSFLATRYNEKGNEILYNLIIGSSYQIDEGVDHQQYAGWEHSYGHNIIFSVPAGLYKYVFENKQELSEILRRDINSVSTVSDEHVSDVVFELYAPDIPIDWREGHGSQTIDQQLTSKSEEDLRSIWTSGYLRLFVSHKAEYKQTAGAVKDVLAFYGVCAFVAHEDIEPTQEWLEKILIALRSMHAFVALMTKDFSISEWTDQEIGMAVDRRVPIIPVHLGLDPYGFIGKYQALKAEHMSSEDLAMRLYDLMWTMPVLRGPLTNGLVDTFANSRTYADANRRMEYVEKIEKADSSVIDCLEKAYEDNPELKGAFKVRGGNLTRVINRLKENG